MQHSHGSSLLASASLVVTVGVTCSWPLGATEHEARRIARVYTYGRSGSLGQHRGGIVIAVGQDEYDEIDAADQVTPELITSLPGLGRLWRRSVSQPVTQSVSGRPCFPVWWAFACLFWLSGSRGLFQAPASFVSTSRQAVESQKGCIVAKLPKLAEQCFGDPSALTGTGCLCACHG